MKRAIVILAAASALGGALAGCATPTPYQPAVQQGRYAYGFSEQKLDETHWRVTFSGNSLTSRERVESYLLYRAAELTVAQGGDWFETTGRATEKKSRYYANPDPFYGAGFGL
ncbi:MAG: CC0125/CC1285 family lipoprotein, partial [Caulobacteraceae bacterium]